MDETNKAARDGCISFNGLEKSDRSERGENELGGHGVVWRGLACLGVVVAISIE